MPYKKHRITILHSDILWDQELSNMEEYKDLIAIAQKFGPYQFVII